VSPLAQTLKLLNQLSQSEVQDGLSCCFALTESGQVVWFDQTGSPMRVAVQGAALVSTGPVSLPTQTVRGISQAEAYEHLTHSFYQPRLAMYRPGGSSRRRVKTSPLVLLFLVLVGSLVLMTNLFSATTITAQTTAVVAARPGDYSPIGAATISRTTFKAFLAELHSPAIPEADSIYSAIVSQGADPALALAFFEHESSGGNAGVASFTKSIGNIRCTPGYACYDSLGNGSFRKYASWTAGATDWVRLLKYYRDGRGLTTLEQIIPVYAPAADNNNEAAYVLAVKHRVDTLREREKSGAN